MQSIKTAAENFSAVRQAARAVARSATPQETARRYGDLTDTGSSTGIAAYECPPPAEAAVGGRRVIAGAGACGW